VLGKKEKELNPEGNTWTDNLFCLCRKYVCKTFQLWHNEMYSHRSIYWGWSRADWNK